MARPVRLLVTENAGSNFVGRLRGAGAAERFRLLVPQAGTEPEFVALAPEADAIVCYQAALTGPVIAAAGSLRLIQKHGLNCRNIDTAAAARRGIPVATLPLMRNVTVAEHALALMLACARRIVPAQQAVTEAVYRELGLEPVQTSQREYRSNWARVPGITELFRATAGIVGMGDIGMEIAKRCRAFDMEILYHQRTRLAAATERDFGMQYAALDALLRAADFVVLVVPHTPATESLINEQTLALMKRSAILVNVGRGGLIDEAALVAALRDGRIAMAGLDVYREEPLPAGHALLGLPNVVLQPHTGGGSYRSWEIDIPALLDNIAQFFETGSTGGLIATGA